MVYVNQGISIIFGGDLSLYGLDKYSYPKFEELKIRPMLENLIDEGLVQSYTVNSSPIYRQFMSLGQSEVQDFTIGDGLRISKSKIIGWMGIFSQSVERDLFDSIKTDEVWWPDDFMRQPLGAGTKIYTESEIIHMIYDIEYLSKFS